MSLSAFPYPGGKTFHVDEILPYFPDHERYVEPFGGSAALLLNKPPSHIEVLNDLDRDIVHFYEVIREQREDLQEWLSTVPYSRDLHKRWVSAFYQGYRPNDDIIRAGRWFYLRYTQYSAKINGPSGFKAPANRDEPSRLRNATEALDLIADRLRNVALECLDYRELCEKYDNEGTLFYFDPPYVGPGDDLYTHEGAFEHTELVGVLEDLDSRWICSYGELPAELAECLDDREWYLREYEIHYTINGDSREKATERLAMNFDPREVAPFKPAEQTGLDAFGGDLA